MTVRPSKLTTAQTADAIRSAGSSLAGPSCPVLPRIPALALLLCSIGVSSCRETIAHNLDEARANRGQLLLTRSGIRAEKVRDGTGWGLSVPTGELLRALEIITKGRVVRDPSPESEPGSSFVSTSEERERAAERELMAALEHSLELLPGVLEARVHLRGIAQRGTVSTDLLARSGVVPQSAAAGAENGFRSRMQRRAGTASVLLIVDGEATLDESTVTRIVAGGSGIAPSEIATVITRTVISGTVISEAGAPLDGDQLPRAPLSSTSLRGSPLRSDPLRSDPLRGDALHGDPLRGNPGDPLRSEPLSGVSPEQDRSPVTSARVEGSAAGHAVTAARGARRSATGATTGMPLLGERLSVQLALLIAAAGGALLLIVRKLRRQQYEDDAPQLLRPGAGTGSRFGDSETGGGLRRGMHESRTGGFRADETSDRGGSAAGAARW